MKSPASPSYINFDGNFDIYTVVPILNKIQKGRSARLIPGETVRNFARFLESYKNFFTSIHLYGGYAPIDKQYFSHYHTTVINYNIEHRTGTVLRQDASNRYYGLNPYVCFEESDRISNNLLLITEIFKSLHIQYFTPDIKLKWKWQRNFDSGKVNYYGLQEY